MQFCEVKQFAIHKTTGLFLNLLSGIKLLEGTLKYKVQHLQETSSYT